MRQHGFRLPLHPLQVVSWVVFGTDVVAYLVLLLPMIESVVATVIVAIGFVASVASLVVATYRATSCNPVDPFVFREEDDVTQEEQDTLPFCDRCVKTVQAKSKHCRLCNKCVGGFDHHCMWLNNCIGAANYNSFFVSISSVGVMIGIVLGTMLYQIIDYATNQENFELRLQASALLNGLSKEGFLGIIIAMCFVNVPLWVLDMQLVVLHTFLMQNNMTTYEYIVMKNQAAEKREIEAASGEAPKRFKSLPGWMDWIVFSRCGQRRRRKKDNIEKIEEAPKRGEADVEIGDQHGTSSERKDDDQRAAGVPPGYTADSDGSASPQPKGKTATPTPEESRPPTAESKERSPPRDAGSFMGSGAPASSSGASPHSPAQADLQALSMKGEASSREVNEGASDGTSPAKSVATLAAAGCGCGDTGPQRNSAGACATL